jgi:hypothetical protein
MMDASKKPGKLHWSAQSVPRLEGVQVIQDRGSRFKAEM